MTLEPYDPLTYENLMRGLTVHFENQDSHRLDGDLGRIQGAGIYALYYHGCIDAYRWISDGTSPIYVGKAVPPGSRKGDTLDPTVPQIMRRLREHKRSIGQAENLEPSEFTFKVLSIVPVWITLAERFLIDNYRPVWNGCLEGFGDHDPGKGRHGGERSWWDTFHPGRPWAEHLREVKTKQASFERISSFFAQSARDVE